MLLVNVKHIFQSVAYIVQRRIVGVFLSINVTLFSGITSSLQFI
jgi:hypothetical protein